jgi:hypothetical protein
MMPPGVRENHYLIISSLSGLEFPKATATPAEDNAVAPTEPSAAAVWNVHNSPLIIEFFSIDSHMSYLKAFIAGFISTLVFTRACCGCCTPEDFRREHLGTWRPSRLSMYLP